MANIQESLGELMDLDGALGAAVVELQSGMSLGSAGSLPNLEVEAAANSDIMKIQYKLLASTGVKEPVEDILISQGERYDLLHGVEGNAGLLIWLQLNRKDTNLGLTRYHIKRIESAMVI